MAKKDLDLSFLKPNAEEFELPSRGLSYDDKSALAKGKIHIRPWITSEEKILYKFDRGNFFNVIKKLVQNAVVEKIDIVNNFRTLDKVIRREFLLAEGDAFNVSKLKDSKKRL